MLSTNKFTDADAEGGWQVDNVERWGQRGREGGGRGEKLDSSLTRGYLAQIERGGGGFGAQQD